MLHHFLNVKLTNIILFTGLIGVHSLLRWAILILLIGNISRNFLNKDKPFSAEDRTWSLRLLIITHINLVIGLIQYFFGAKGFAFVKTYGMAEVMKNSVMRFWVVEHITGMLIAVVLITIANSVSKKVTDNDTAKHSKLMWLYIAALVIIIAVIPWPFRQAFSDMPWVRGLY